MARNLDEPGANFNQLLELSIKLQNARTFAGTVADASTEMEQYPDTYLRPGETLEDWEGHYFRKPNAAGGRIYGKYAQQLASGGRVGLSNGGDVTSKLAAWVLKPENLERLKNNKDLVRKLTKIKALPSSVRLYIRNLAGVTDKITEDFFSKSELAEIKKRVSEAKANKSMGDAAISGLTTTGTGRDNIIGYQLEKGRLSLAKAFTDDATNIDMTLGQATFSTDDKGNIKIVDTHNFYPSEGGGTIYEDKEYFPQRKKFTSVVPHRDTHDDLNEVIQDPKTTEDEKEWYENLKKVMPNKSLTFETEESDKQLLKRAKKALEAGDIDPSKYARIVAGMQQGDGIPIELNIGKITQKDKLEANPNFASYLSTNPDIPTKIRTQAQEYLNAGGRVGYGEGDIVPKRKPKDYAGTLKMLLSQKAWNTLGPRTWTDLTFGFAKKAHEAGQISDATYKKLMMPMFGETGEKITKAIEERDAYHEAYNEGGRVGLRSGTALASYPPFRGTSGSSGALKAWRGQEMLETLSKAWLAKKSLEKLPEANFLKKDESKKDIVETIEKEESDRKEPDQEPPEDPDGKLIQETIFEAAKRYEEGKKISDAVKKLKKHEKRIPVEGEKNITQVGNRFEVRISRGGETFEERFDTLELATEFRDKIAQIPSTAGQHMIGKSGELSPSYGKYKEEGGAQNIREILTGFIAQGKTTYTTQEVLDLVNPKLLKDESAVKQTLQKIKKEKPFKNLEFVSYTGGPMEFSAEAIQVVLDNYGKLTNEHMAELIFPGVNKTTAIARVKRIRKELVAEGKIEEMKPGDVPTEVSDTFDLSPENIKRQIFQKERVDTIKELGSKKYEKELFKFKKKIQNVLGLKKIQTKGDREIDQIDIGHRSSIKQLKALNEKITPADIGPDFYKANRLGIKKYKEGVKTLEGILKRDFYPKQLEVFKKAKKFLDEGKTIPVEIRKEIVKINDGILEVVDNANLEGRINALTLDPFTLEVKRNENVARTVGFGLTETAFEDVEIGGEDDAVNKLMYAQQILAEAVSAGLIDEAEGTTKLDEFFNTRLLKKKGGPVYGPYASQISQLTI